MTKNTSAQTTTTTQEESVEIPTWTNPVTQITYTGEAMVRLGKTRAKILGQLPETTRRAGSVHREPTMHMEIENPELRAGAQQALRAARRAYGDLCEARVVYGEKAGVEDAEIGKVAEVLAAHAAFMKAQVAYFDACEAAMLAGEPVKPLSCSGGTNPNVLREKHGVAIRPGTKRTKTEGAEA